MRKVTSCLLFFIAFPSLAFAQGVEPERNEDGWSFGAGFYASLVNIDGVTSVGPKEIETDVSFDELVDSLEGAFLFHFEALSNARVGLAVDYAYTTTTNKRTRPWISATTPRSKVFW